MRHPHLESPLTSMASTHTSPQTRTIMNVKQPVTRIVVDENDYSN